jgi:hypothetical protein
MEAAEMYSDLEFAEPNTEIVVGVKSYQVV